GREGVLRAPPRRPLRRSRHARRTRRAAGVATGVDGAWRPARPAHRPRAPAPRRRRDRPRAGAGGLAAPSRPPRGGARRMKLELPLVVVHHALRQVEALLPGLGLQATGPSLAELRDDLALRVMLQVEAERVARLARYQLAPHLRLRHVAVEATVRDE